ncbi:MAG: 50S ribosomal protein L17 [Candidatus Harrisonbacteria bacterium]|nr:50S ribosomal protein L17 [Candidatus Harrisonbacteria bacterium]
MRKFHRIRGRRKLFVQTLVHNLIMKEKMQTTEARAKEVRPLVEKLVTIAKEQNLASLRRLLSKLPKKSATKLYYDIAPKYQNRAGGYLRILKTALRRKRDAAQQAVIEFVQ